jgi:hypothetical protein
MMGTLLAQVDISNEFCLRIQGGQCIAIKEVIPNLGVLISILLKNALVLAGVIFFFLLIFGGFGLIMGAGSGDAKKTAQGQQALTTAGVGFILVVTSYWLIQIIETRLGISITNPQLK